jgi:site-specific DNA-methyltransferase (adenine-specific)
MKPYYETENGVLYNADCIDVMRGFDDKQFDLILTDPPYGIGQKIERDYKPLKAKTHRIKYLVPVERWDNKPPTKEHFYQIKRISKNQIIFGGNYFTNKIDPSPCWLVWDKETTGRFSDCELIYTSFRTAVRKFKYRWNGMLKEYPETRYHPTQKPVGLFKQIISKYADIGQKICDPFAGSGTTALACEAYGLEWVCIEKETDYCDIIVDRLETETRQLKLF